MMADIFDYLHVYSFLYEKKIFYDTGCGVKNVFYNGNHRWKKGF